MSNKETLGKPGKMRIDGIDVIKSIATLFVVILHIDSYAKQLMGESFSDITKIMYNILEAIAYPAIHLFVLCGSFLMQSKKR